MGRWVRYGVGALLVAALVVGASASARLWADPGRAARSEARETGVECWTHAGGCLVAPTPVGGTCSCARPDRPPDLGVVIPTPVDG